LQDLSKFAAVAWWPQRTAASRRHKNRISRTPLCSRSENMKPDRLRSCGGVSVAGASPGRRYSSERDARLLWAGETVSLFGDQMTQLALPLVVIVHTGGGASDAAVLVAVSRLPYLMLSLPAGVWIDRIGQWTTMVVSDSIRAFVVLALVVALVAGFLTVEHIALGAFALGAGAAFFNIAYPSYVPMLVRHRSELQRVNARLAVSEGVSITVGPGVAGWLVAALGAAAVLALDAVTYVFSLAMLLLIRHRDAHDRQAATPLREGVTAGLRYVFEHPELRPILLCSTLYCLGLGGVQALLVAFAAIELALSPEVIGVVFAIGGFGFVMGNVATRHAEQRLGLRKTLVTSAACASIGLAAMPLAHGGSAAIALSAAAFVNSFGQGIYYVTALTLRQVVADESMLTRTNAVYRFATWGALPVGAFVAALLTSIGPIRLALVLSAGLALTCVLPLAWRRQAGSTRVD